MSNSTQPHRQQPTRLPCPWDSPGKNTGLGCHFLLQCMKVKSESEVAQLCLTLSDPMECSLPGSSVHGIFQARVPEWRASAFSENSCYFKAKDHRSQYPNAGEGVEKREGLWAMAPHSSTLAWKIPWTEEPGRLHSMGSLRVGHD